MTYVGEAVASATSHCLSKDDEFDRSINMQVQKETQKEGLRKQQQVEKRCKTDRQNRVIEKGTAGGLAPALKMKRATKGQATKTAKNKMAASPFASQTRSERDSCSRSAGEEQGRY